MKGDKGDREFEVDDALCNGERTCDLKFCADYTFKSKKPEHCYPEAPKQTLEELSYRLRLLKAASNRCDCR